MRRYKGFRSVLFLILGAAAASLHAAALEAEERPSTSLSGAGWRVWLDEKAPWKTDKLYLPQEVDLQALPVNPPTGGWEILNERHGVGCTVPACVEEIFSGGTNAWRYCGVSWFWRTVVVPKEWQGKRVYVDVEKARLRVELYVNGKLAGYDLVAETPFRLDVTPYLKFGEANRLAFRLTNPGGSRGWQDFPGIKWGDYVLPSSHDFAGLGHVNLAVKDPVHVEDVFVKNERPAGARKISVQVTLNNTTPETVRRTVQVVLQERGSSGKVAEPVTQDVEMKPGLTTVAIPMVALQAKLWDMDNPNLYDCVVSLEGSRGRVADQVSQTFGFRVFEVNAPAGDPNYYLNGKRLRHRSAIDWGFYALTGFYATGEMARKSVEAARAIGHNGINFHRRIGEPLVMKEADELGLYIFEEPGAFHVDFSYNIKDGSFAAGVMLEKCRRMILRDRNHPSLIIYCLANEDNGWNKSREAAMHMVRDLDGTRLVVNTSGANVAGPKGPVKHLRPYEVEIREDFRDDHTVQSAGRFPESVLNERAPYQEQFPSNLVYWGEVGCYTGPANWFDVAGMRARIPDGRPGYDLNLYAPLAVKIADYFKGCRVSQLGSKVIRTPSDVARQAGRGLMYTDGRYGQAIMSNDGADGYAINGWSAGPQLPNAWDSAICDEGRNLKGPAADFAYWIRPLQVMITRTKGKTFKPGNTTQFRVALINEGRLPAGVYRLEFSIKDGAGVDCGTVTNYEVNVSAGDVYAQKLEPLTVTMKPEWHGGHITIQGVLTKAGKRVADGTEQVLLANRPSFKRELDGLTCAVVGWPAAGQALAEAGVTCAEFSADRAVQCLLAGAVPTNTATLDAMLTAVHERGTILIVRFDEAWARELHTRRLLSEPVTQWGGEQTGHWNGNGWGYLDHFVGGQAIPSGRTIGTTSWEVPEDPRGFAPFASTLPQGSYGAYLARKEGPNNSTKRIPGKKERRVPLVPDDTLMVLLGTLDYGKGKVVLQASYPVDQNHAFSDLLFYNLVSMGVRNNW